MGIPSDRPPIVQSHQPPTMPRSRVDMDTQFPGTASLNKPPSKTHSTVSPQTSTGITTVSHPTSTEIKGGSAVSYIKSCFPDSPRAAKAACFCAGLGLCVKGVVATLILKLLKPALEGAIKGGAAGAVAGAITGAIAGAMIGSTAAGVGAAPGAAAGAIGLAITFGFLGALAGACFYVNTANDLDCKLSEEEAAANAKDDAIISGIFQEAMSCFAAALSDSPLQKTAQ